MKSRLTFLLIDVKRWSKLLVGTLTLSIGASLLSLIGITFVLRFLPSNEAGYFALWLTLVQTITLIGALGQPTLTLRLYSNQPCGYFAWPRDMISLLGAAAPVIIILALLCSFLYHLPVLHLGLLLITALGSVTLSCLAPIFTSQGSYTWGNFLIRLPNALMIIPAVGVMLESRLSWLFVLLMFQAFAVLISVGIGIFFLLRRAKVGTAQVTLLQRGYGLVFLISASSTIVPDQLVFAIAGMTISRIELAGLVAIFTLFGSIQLIQNILTQVFIAEIARRDDIHYGRLIAGMWLLGIVMIFASVIFVPILLHLLFGGRYDFVLYLIFWIAIANALDLIETVPRSYLMGRASSQWLNRLIFSQLGISAVGILLAIYLIRMWGMFGTVLAIIHVFVLRNIVSYGLFYLARHPAKASHHVVQET